MHQPHDEPDYKRLFTAIFLAAALLFAWQALVEWPRKQALAEYTIAKEKVKKKRYQSHSKSVAGITASTGAIRTMSREDSIASNKRVVIKNNKIEGSLSLTGARFDDLRLINYRTELDPDSPEVLLLSPNDTVGAYFAQIGWVGIDNSIKVPDAKTQWKADRDTLAANETVNLRWNNGQGVTFHLAITLTGDYMFNVKQRVDNNSGHDITLFPYAYINRTYSGENLYNAIMHEGPIGVMQETLNEVSYDELVEDGAKTFENATGWLGITDKYWLSALIPNDDSYKVTFNHYKKNNQDRYQVDYLSTAVTINDKQSSSYDTRLFAGAKEVPILDKYAKGNAAQNMPPIQFFDRAVDFGFLYFLTKPMFYMLNFFYNQAGNFGIAIIMLTLCVKLVMYPLANKSYKASSQMRELQPEMKKIKERHVDDQIAANKEMMALYKREKVNPASGCLPVLIQMPVFFALYKVLFVTIEMRHAPFIGYLKDLSVMDPSNIFTAFGLLDWGPPSWLSLGLLPILMCGSMAIQMKQQPTPTDPIQAKVMTWMPYFLLLIFARMPAGLVLYWTCSNILSILQQHVITKRLKAAKAAQKLGKATT